jgi:hypothetical protein
VRRIHSSTAQVEEETGRVTQTNGEKGIHPQAQVEEETGRVIQTKVNKDYSSTSSHLEEIERESDTDQGEEESIHP